MANKGSTGLKIWSGTIQEDFLRELRFPNAYNLYNEMRLNSPVIGAMLLSAQQSIRGIKWTFTSDLGEDDPRLEISKKSWDNIDHNSHISEALTFLPFGFSIFEIVWKRDGSAVVLDKLAFRGQDTVYSWLWDDNHSRTTGFEQRAAPKYKLVTLKEKTLLHYRASVEKNNPEGRSILRTAWVPYYYAKNLMQVEAIGEERGLAGLPIIYPPMGANMDENDSSSDYATASKTVRNTRRDEQEGIVMPGPKQTGDESPGWLLELLSTGQNRAFQTDIIIKRYESRMLMSALAQFLLLGQDKVGSNSLSQDQTDFYTMSVNAAADIISESFTAQLLPRLMALNGYTADGLLMEHSPAGDVNLESLGDFLQKMAPMLTWTPEDEVWIRDTARLPTKTVEEIEAAQEEERQRLQDEAALFPQAGAFGRPAKPAADDDMDDDDVDENAALVEMFGSEPPDDDARRKEEGILKRTMRSFWKGERKRIGSAARKI